MGALLPTLQAEHLREGLTDYRATTFALTHPYAQAALTDFIGDPGTGMFKGPYVRLRLPFAPAGDQWTDHLDWWPQGFMPYGHQARTFERLSTKHRDRPQPTLVTTGTGSGKTESFLIPILDHVLRATKSGVTGMKALILYPMNALANDQAERLAHLIAGDPALAAVTAGLYTGEQSTGGRTERVFPAIPVERDAARTRFTRVRFLHYVFAMLSPIRAEVGRVTLGVDAHLWIRELSRVDRAVRQRRVPLVRRRCRCR